MKLSFKQWLKEMAGTGVVMGHPCHTPNVGPDAQVWGDPAASCRSMKKCPRNKKAKK